MTVFADPRLELAVRAALPQEVLAQPLSSLTHLRAASLGVRRLGGIATLSELRFVDLSDNPLTSLVELGGNTKLIQAELRGVHAASLEGLAGLPDLEGVDLRGARVIDIRALTGLPTLRTLDIGSCLVRELGPVSTLTKLESLTLGAARGEGATKLDLAPLGGLSNLRQLRIYGLHLESSAVFDEFVNLEELVLERCSFGDQLLGLRRLPRLEYLSLAGCRPLKLSALEGQERLHCVVLDEAEFDSLAPLCGLESLERLSLRGIEANKIPELSRLRARANLRELRVGDELLALG